MNLETIQITDLSIYIACLIIWILLLPQIKLFIEERDPDLIPIDLVLRLLVPQVLILILSMLFLSWTSVFTMGISISFHGFTIGFVYYYRRYPGGKNS